MECSKSSLNQFEEQQTRPSPTDLGTPLLHTRTHTDICCRVIVGKVKATVTNTYSWTIERQSTASGVAVSADAYNRKQLGEHMCSVCWAAMITVATPQDTSTPVVLTSPLMLTACPR